MSRSYPNAVVYKLSYGNDAFIGATVHGVPSPPTAEQMDDLRTRLVYYMRHRLYRFGFRADGTVDLFVPNPHGMTHHPSYLALDRIGFDKFRLDILEHCPCDQPGQAVKRATTWCRREKPNLNGSKS